MQDVFMKIFACPNRQSLPNKHLASMSA